MISGKEAIAALVWTDLLLNSPSSGSRATSYTPLGGCETEAPEPSQPVLTVI